MTVARIAMIGAGFIGQIGHLRNLAQIERCRVVALAEARPGLREVVRRHYAIPDSYADHQPILADPLIDGVVLVTRRHHAGPAALDVLRSGKSLLMEKPMAATLAQAEELLRAAREGGVPVFSIGYMRRHDEGVQLAKSILDTLIETGELGEILHARLQCFCGEDYCKADGFLSAGEPRLETFNTWPIAPDWLAPELHAAYDAFMNIWVHDINLVRHFLGFTPEIAATKVWPGRGGSILMDCGEYPLDFSFGEMNHNGWDERLEITFRKGRLTVELPPALHRNTAARVTVYDGRNNGQTRIHHPDWSWAFRRQAEAFVEDILENRAPLASGADAVEDLRLIETIWRRIAGIA